MVLFVQSTIFQPKVVFLSKKFQPRRKVHIINSLGSYATLVHDKLLRTKKLVLSEREVVGVGRSDILIWWTVEK